MHSIRRKNVYISLVHYSLPLPSIRKKYGKVYSMKVGSFKLVVVEDTKSVKEVLVKKSADYAGRPPFHSFVDATMGRYLQVKWQR